MSNIILPKDFGGSLWARYNLSVVRDGKIIDECKGPSRSFTRWFGLTIYGTCAAINPTITRSDGVPFTAGIISGASAAEGTFSSLSLATSARIKLGDSTAAVTSTQYNLQGTILATITLSSTTTLTMDDTKYEWRHEAQQLNSGASYTVWEMGLFALMTNQGSSGQSYETMFMRDVLGASVTVPNGSTAVARYEFTAAV